MSRRDDHISLQQMRDHAREVLAFSAGKDLNDLETDRVLALAMVRLLEVIGEAATRVSNGMRSQHPTIPWSQIVSLRNRLIHGYDSVDLSIVMAIIRDDIPHLYRELDTILEDDGS